jgi:quercetin dioxygenase-like cupin family protein
VSNFVNLNKTLLSMQIDAATAKQPIKRMFVADGDFFSANVSILTDAENALHTQPDHDEIVLVLEGEVEFRVGLLLRSASVN